MDADLKQQLDAINKNLLSVASKVGGGWKAFGYGVARGFGSVIGAALAIVIIGWVLNTLGYIPAFQDQVNEWKQIIQKTEQNTRSIDQGR